MKTVISIFVCLFTIINTVQAHNLSKPKPSYSFSSSLVAKITTTGSKKKDNFTIRYKYLFTKDIDAMGMKFVESDNPDMAKLSQMMELVLIDFEEQKMYNFINSDGTKTVLGLSFKGDKFQKTIEKENNSIKITKNAQTKTIAGYKCDGYDLEHEGNKDKVIMWVSQSSIGIMVKMVEKMSKGASSMAKSKNYLDYGVHPELKKLAEQGRMTLGYSSISKNGDKIEMEFEKLNANDKFVFETSVFKSLF